MTSVSGTEDDMQKKRRSFQRYESISFSRRQVLTDRCMHLITDLHLLGPGIGSGTGATRGRLLAMGTRVVRRRDDRRNRMRAAARHPIHPKRMARRQPSQTWGSA